MAKKKKTQKSATDIRKASKKEEELGQKGYQCVKCGSQFAKFKKCVEHMDEAGHFPQNWENLLWRSSLPGIKRASKRPKAFFSQNLHGSLALEMLRLMFVHFRGKTWPMTRVEMREIVHSLCLDNQNEKLARWFESVQKDPEIVMGKLRRQWMQAGCMLLGGKKVFWNHERICFVLETYDQPVKITPQDKVDHEVQLPFWQDKANVKFIDTTERLKHMMAYDTFKAASELKSGAGGVRSCPETTVALFCESVEGKLLLLQLATSREVYVFDCLKLGGSCVCSFLAPMFANENIRKLIHNCHSFLAALATTGKVPNILGAVDTQLAMELVTGEVYMNCNHMLLQLGIPASNVFTDKPADPAVFQRRPLPSKLVTYAAYKTKRLLTISASLKSVLDMDGIEIVKDATFKRLKRTEGLHWVCFDMANGYSLASPELMELTRPDEIWNGSPLQIVNDINDFLELLPKGISEELSNRTDNLTEVHMDLGRPPQAWIAGKQVLLNKTIKEVEKGHITAVVQRLGGFSSGNCAEVERQLHRISALRNLAGDVIGVTMRVGRYIIGNADMISDILRGNSRSVLLLGESGSGKTAVLRDVSRLLAKNNNVCIVDTSNEIAGDGNIPHTCIGDARRMMVPSLSRQGAVMIECVQNHSPSVMVIDEIGSSSAVDAVRTCKQRGVRMIASTRGDLRKLLKNQQLQSLVGSVESVVVGDKEVLQRVGAPTFEVIVESRRGKYNDWRIVLDTATAVDSILRGELYTAEIRTRDPLSGQIRLKLVEA